MVPYNQTQLQFIKERTITDVSKIEQYEKEFNYNFFFPKYEHEALDTEAIQKHVYTESGKLIGERVPILIAVNDKDPYIDNERIRIHGRFIDGKHKYLDSKSLGIRWSVNYVYIKDYQEFVKIWLNSDLNKNEATSNLQLKQRIKDTCEYLWMTKPDSIKDAKGMPQKHNIGKVIVSMFISMRSKRSIYYYIPKDFINETMSESHKVSKTLNLSKKDKVILQITQERDKLIEELERAKIRSMPETGKDLLIKELERKKQKLILSLGSIKSYMRKERKRLGVDKTEKDFDIWWSRFE